MKTVEINSDRISDIQSRQSNVYLRRMEPAGGVVPTCLGTASKLSIEVFLLGLIECGTESRIVSRQIICTSFTVNIVSSDILAWISNL